MRQQPIARISFSQCRSCLRALPIGGAGHQFAQQRLHVPVQIVLKMKRQPVEQFGMAGLLAHAAEILQRLYDSCPEELLPVAIDRRARGQWLSGQKEPLGQRQAIARSTCGKLWKYSRDVGRERRTDLGQEIAALEFQRRPLFIGCSSTITGSSNAGNLRQLVESSS